MLSSSVSTHFLAFRKYTKVDMLAVNDLPAGTRVRVQCKTKKKKQQKKGCPYKSRTVATTFPRARLNVLKPFRKKKMPRGDEDHDHDHGAGLHRQAVHLHDAQPQVAEVAEAAVHPARREACELRWR